MVPGAFGTQTSSSIIRPAAFCGVVGYKPSFGLINRAGLKFLSESLDTIGTLTRTVADAALIVEELAGLPPARFDEVHGFVPRVGLCRTPYWSRADVATQANLESAAEKLAHAGARVSAIELPAEFTALAETQISVSSYEFYRALTHERTRFPELISASLTARIAAGGAVTRAQYEAGLALTARCRAEIDEVLRDFDALLAPSAPGEAPSIATTGDPIFGLMWTLLRLPCLTLPYGEGPSGLPLGVQVIGRRGEDPALFVSAEWIIRALDRA
jgi:amidase